MNPLQENITVSFKNVKEDVFELRQEISQLNNVLVQAMRELESVRKQHEQDLRRLATLKAETKTIIKKVPVTKTIVKKVVSKKKDIIVASKDGNGKAHLKSCPFAKNIKKQKVFKTKTQAFKKGYKACKCLQ